MVSVGAHGCGEYLPKVRILDTPGLADTRSPQQDELHKQSIETETKNQIDFVSVVLVLANGTLPRVTVGTDYALSTLSAIFPNTLTNNIVHQCLKLASLELLQGSRPRCSQKRSTVSPQQPHRAPEEVPQTQI